MRIKCPECESVLTLGQPKPGSYRPKCKHCGKPFRLKITDDDPPKVGVGRIAKDAAAGHDAGTKSKPGTDGSANKARGKEAPSKPQPATPIAEAQEAVAATLDSAAPAGSAVEATLDSVAPITPSTADKTMGSGPGEQTAGVTDATIDGTVAGASGGSIRSGSVRSGSVRSGSVRSGSPPSTGKQRKVVVSAGASAGKRQDQVAAAPTGVDADELPERLGGYRILRLLGRGAMGAVYEAKQMSLDRLVALKTIRGRLANNPSSLARFTREAYAAAQLTHHNVVQIYDFGEDAGRHFFSMEWVRGGPLDDLIREKGSLDAKLAAGYVLQAARGLQFAHRNGMVHRDVKPANLLLSDEGVIKVADLGLVKVPDQMDPESDVGEVSSMSGLASGTQVTMQGTAVGTPAYMAPEQGVDAATVDHRADIYSLGCTLFYLLAGKPPFQGSVVSEVLEQHASEPLPSLVGINSRVPEALQNIVERSMAKRPEDRYPSVSEMIVDLESFLGVSADGKFSPTREQADQWESIAARYSGATPLMRLSWPLLASLIMFSGLLTVIVPLFALRWTLLGPALMVAALGTALLLGASSGKSAVVRSIRHWLGSLSWMDYGVGAIGVVIVLLVVFFAGLWPGLIVGGILGAIAGAAYHYLLIAPTRSKSSAVIEDAERFVRDLRLAGADEEGVRQFTARYAGKSWQALFESLFGYESLGKVREQLRADPSFSGPTAAGSLRERVCARLASKAKANREARDHAQLAKIEQRGLQSEGVSAADARDRAWQMAAAVMDNAKIVAPSTDATAAAQAKRDQMKAMLAEARSGNYRKKRDVLAPIRFALGGQTRLLVGCLLLAVFAVWGNNNGLFESLKDIGSGGVDVGSALRGAATTASESATETKVLGSETSAWSTGLAGLLLCMSAFVSGWRMTPFAVIATIVILFGPTLGIPAVGEMLRPWMVSAVAGIVIYVPGVLFGEKA